MLVFIYLSIIIFLLCPILERYIVLCNSIDQIKSIKVTSTIPIYPYLKKVLVTRINQLTKSKKILLTNLLDTRIVGGLIIETSTNIIDISLKERLKTLMNLV